MFQTSMQPMFFLLLLIVCVWIPLYQSTPKSSPNWEELIAVDGIKFVGRNAHASCVFKDLIWVTGGRTDLYTMYNLLESYRQADVWHSIDGALWKQEDAMTGDFWAQNIDVVQPGSIAPWFQRYGHSLDAIDITGDGEADVMILMGGFASNPHNDIWISEDGSNWVYCGLAPWLPRAWHSTLVYNNSLFMMGGTPLNNEVWRLDKVMKDYSRVTPLTRSLYSEYTYNLTWTQLPNAPWSPRVGAGLVEHLYYNVSNGETAANARLRMVLAGGFGGWLEDSPYGEYDGFYSRADTWETADGYNWTLLNNNCSFQGRAWFGMGVMADPNRTNSNILGAVVAGRIEKPSKIYIFGGGYIGSPTTSIQVVSSMIGRADGYWSYDAINWVKINYEEGGGSSTIPFFSSQEWSKTIVDTNTKYLGNWGHTMEKIKIKGVEKFVFIAGDFSGSGDFTPSTYVSLSGIFCDIEGSICSGFGTCMEFGCVCLYGATGDQCQYGGVLPV